MKVNKECEIEKAVVISLSQLLDTEEKKSAYGDADKNIRTILTVTNVTSPKAQESAAEFLKFMLTPVTLEDGSQALPLPDELYIKLDASAPNCYSVAELKSMSSSILAMGKEFAKYEHLRIAVNPYAKKILDAGKKIFAFAVKVPEPAAAKK
jgi:hypothetical protein